MAINQMPHNLDAEKALLGCILLDEGVQAEILDDLSADDFYQESHREILLGMKAVHASGKAVDIVTLTDKLSKDGRLNRAGGVQAVTEIAENALSSVNYKQYLEIVKRDSINRKLIRASKEVIEKCMDSPEEKEALDFAEKKVYGISQNEESTALKGLEDGTDMSAVLDRIELIQTNPDSARGVETGFPRLDRKTNGLQKSDLIIIAARPGAGKTSFAMNIVEHACLQRGKVAAIFSLEMSRKQLLQRLLCSYSGVSMKKVNTPTADERVTSEDFKKLWSATDKINKSKIFIDDKTNITAGEILSKCRRLKSSEGRLDLVMIDYIQLMQGDSVTSTESRQQVVAEITRGLKIMAKELDVPVIALSQLRRFQGKEAQLTDLRESGAIEQDADIVMFINRFDQNATKEELQSGKVVEGASELNISKFRNGEPGRIQLRFIGSKTKFVEVDLQGRPEEEPQYGKGKKSAWKEEDDDTPDDGGIPIE